MAYRRDRWHGVASEQLRSFSAQGIRLLTTNYVVDETATRLRYDAGLPIALTFRQLLEDARRAGRLRVVWVDERLDAEGWALLERYPDVRLSLTDAVSAAVARTHRIKEIFSFDADFRALGFVVRPG